MSLLVWLPLNGDLTNQGLSNAQFKVNNAVSTLTEGKIGSCYYLNGTALSSPNFSALQDATDYSACCWIKFTKFPDAGSNAYCICLNGSTASSYKFVLGVFSATSSDGTVASVRLNSKSSSGCNIYLNTWYHLAITVKGSSGNIYINGELKDTISGLSPVNSATNLIIGGRSSNANGTSFLGLGAPAYYNDVRVYDHCLSQKEIQEISKGLILHMPLDNNGMGGINLFKGNYSAVTTKDGTVQSGDIAFDTSIMDLNSLIGKTIWYSFDYQCLGDKLNATGNYTTDRYGSHLTLNYVDSSGATKTAYPCASMLEFTGTGRAVQSYTIPSNIQSITSLSGTKQPYNLPAATNNSTWYLKNFKLEVGDYATPYSPNPTDMGIDLKSINEVSGFNLTGTAVQVMNIANNAPRYNVSTQWKDTTDFIHIPSFFASNQLIDEITIAGWFKTNTLNGTNPNMFNYGANEFVRGRITSSTSLWSYWNINGNKKSINVSAGKALNDDTWHHYAFSFNKGVIKTYVDGILKNTTDHTASGTQLKVGSITNWGLGGYSPTGEKFLGYQSDFRTYCTALEDSEILELYEGRPGIDNNGNSFFYKIEENEATPVGIKNTCVAMAPRDFYEDDIENLAYNTQWYDYEGKTITFTPTNKDNANTPGFRVHYGGPHMHNKKVKIDLDVTWSGGFAFDSAQSTAKIYFQGPVILPNGTTSWTNPSGASNALTSALNSAQDLKNLVLSSASGTYHYSVICTIKTATDSINYAEGHCIGMRSNYQTGSGTITLSNIKVTPMEAFSSDDQPFKISKDNITANYIYEF